MSELLPIFLKLEGRKVVVVGGGKVAEAKLDALWATGARLTVVAPEVRPGMVREGVTVVRRPFEPGDLDGAWLAVAAAAGAVNRQVAAAAAERRVWACAVDEPAEGSAFGGGVLRRGGVTLAVSTGGVAPALAGLLREALEAVLPEELGSWLETARALRERQRAEGVPLERRRPLLLEALARLYTERAA